MNTTKLNIISIKKNDVQKSSTESACRLSDSAIPYGATGDIPAQLTQPCTTDIAGKIRYQQQNHSFYANNCTVATGDSKQLSIEQKHRLTQQADVNLSSAFWAQMTPD